MSDPSPSPIPLPAQRSRSADPMEGLEDYQRIAETVGGPSLRIKDNVIQAAVVIGGMVLGAIVG